MKNIIQQVKKVAVLYIAGFGLAYLSNIIIYSFTEDAGFVWLISICLSMAVMGIISFCLFDFRGISFEKRSGKISLAYYKNLGLQLAVAGVLLAIVAVIDYNQAYVTTFGYYNILDKFLNDNLARYLSFGTLPVINMAYFLIVSIYWLSYNASQFIIDKRTNKTSSDRRGYE